MQLWRPAVVIAGTTTFISHEFGHVIVAKAYGADTAPPLFIPLGVVTIGSTRMRKMPKNGRHRAGIYLAGPIAGLATASMVLISFIGTPWLVIGILFVGSEAYSYFLGSDAVRAKKARKKHE